MQSVTKPIKMHDTNKRSADMQFILHRPGCIPQASVPPVHSHPRAQPASPSAVAIRPAAAAHSAHGQPPAHTSQLGSGPESGSAAVPAAAAPAGLLGLCWLPPAYLPPQKHNFIMIEYKAEHQQLCNMVLVQCCSWRPTGPVPAASSLPATTSLRL